MRILPLLALLAMAATASAQDTWTDKTTTNGAPFIGQGFASDGTYLYTFGEYNSQVFTPVPSHRWDPTTDAWVTRAATPVRWHGTGTYWGGLIYAFGNDYGNRDEIYRYDVALDAWETLAETLTPVEALGEVVRSDRAAVTLGDRIYITGGKTIRGLSRRCIEFDPTTDPPAMRLMADMPQGVWRHCVAPFPARGSIFLLGGQGNDAYSRNYCWEFVPAAGANGTWTTRATMNINGVDSVRTQARAFTLNDRVFVSGGWGQTTLLKDMIAFDPWNNTWTPGAPMNHTRGGMATATIAGQAWVHGGNANVNSKVEECYTPVALIADAVQIGAKGVVPVAGTVGRRVTFAANILQDGYRLDVQLKHSSEPWSDATLYSSPQLMAGYHAVEWTAPNGGAYDWRFRATSAFATVPDAFLESLDWSELSSGPEFFVDLSAPPIPAGISPHDVDVNVEHPIEGPVTFTWNPVVDSGLIGAVTYDFEVTGDMYWNGGIIQLTGLTDTFTTVTLPVSQKFYAWRVRAIDAAGNASEWSLSYLFRAIYDDHLKHAAGDATKACGFACPGGASALWILVLALVARRRA